MKKPILCLDFDGVIHSYSSGWKGADVVSDPPVPGAMAFIIRAVQHFDVQIYSSRSHQDGGIRAMRTYIAEQMRLHVRDSQKPQPLPKDIDAVVAGVGALISFPTAKPPAMVSIDDRAITFMGVWPDLETLQNFKPWNKR